MARDPFEKMEKIDAERQDPTAPESEHVFVCMEGPRTSGGSVYPTTLVVNVDPGRWPQWLQPYVGYLRRIQTRQDPDYGFITPTYNALNVTSYVLADGPGGKYQVFDILLQAVKKSGWEVSTPKGAAHVFEAWAPSV